jgi:hypothetical protein
VIYRLWTRDRAENTGDVIVQAQALIALKEAVIRNNTVATEAEDDSLCSRLLSLSTQRALQLDPSVRNLLLQTSAILLKLFWPNRAKDLEERVVSFATSCMSAPESEMVWQCFGM